MSTLPPAMRLTNVKDLQKLYAFVGGNNNNLAPLIDYFQAYDSNVYIFFHRSGYFLDMITSRDHNFINRHYLRVNSVAHFVRQHNIFLASRA